MKPAIPRPRSSEARPRGLTADQGRKLASPRPVVRRRPPTTRAHAPSCRAALRAAVFPRGHSAGRCCGRACAGPPSAVFCRLRGCGGGDIRCHGAHSGAPAPPTACVAHGTVVHLHRTTAAGPAVPCVPRRTTSPVVPPSTRRRRTHGGCCCAMSCDVASPMA